MLSAMREKFGGHVEAGEGSGGAAIKTKKTA
jgi:hypothetical protein